MCFRSVDATTSRRRRSPRRRQAPTLPPLAVLDLSKPAERQAHDFLCRATRTRGGLWNLVSLHRQGDLLLCIVRWVHPDNRAKPFSLAEVSLMQPAVRWHDYPSAQAAQAALSCNASAPLKAIHSA
ncbi:MAG: hypothetical protein JNJ46_31580 [Myxococcales bacterium]|nr:hypothetical protein [Myxococcales bacterium]